MKRRPRAPEQDDLLRPRLTKTIDALSREAETSRRLQTMPGVGPIAALAIETFALPIKTFSKRSLGSTVGLA